MDARSGGSALRIELGKMMPRKVTIEADDKKQGMTPSEVRAAVSGIPQDSQVRANVTIGGRIKEIVVIYP